MTPKRLAECKKVVCVHVDVAMVVELIKEVEKLQEQVRVLERLATGLGGGR